LTKDTGSDKIPHFYDSALTLKRQLEMTNTLSTYLFASPSFLGGMAHLLDFGGTLNQYNSSMTNEEADYLALMSDWLMVGSDIELAIEECVDENILCEATLVLLDAQDLIQV
jgi:hypothetical protein